ncbi:phage tail length tape measure family protein [Comamonas sp.]|uniref:phage tail length tape measure family protein n=1 Tax=Comamonas sp. TaxID=34028 RepID=UPI0028A59810|nr:phage tail length tape measure family protein [Comamonas sp.]
MADLTKNINVGVDASGVKTGLQEATKSIKDFGKTVQDESNKGAGGVDRLGESVKKLGPATDSSMKVSERAFKGWSSEVTRAATQIQAAGDKVREFELKAQLKGFSPNMYKPQIDALRAVIAEQDRLRASNTNLGMSAAATAAAMRNVPAQFTDIVVSLQAGQAPMTVLLQQGGQLKDMFGGVGNAAKAIGGYIWGLVNPFTLAAAALAGFAVAALSAEKTLRTEASWQTYASATGRAVGLSVESFKSLRDEMALLPGVSKATASAVINDLATMRDLGTTSLKGIASIAADVAVLMRTDMPTAAKELGKAFVDPAKGVGELNGQLKVFSATQIAAIEALAEMGDKAGAQALMLDTLKQASAGLATQGLTPLQQATNNFGNTWDAAMKSLNGAGGTLRAVSSLMAGLVQHTADAVHWLSQLKVPKELENLFKGGLNGMVYGWIAGPQKPAFTGGASGEWGASSGGASGSWNGPDANDETNAWNNRVAALRAATDRYKATSQQMADLRKNASDLSSTIAELVSKGDGQSELANKLRENLAGVNEQLATLAKRSVDRSGDAAIKKEMTAYNGLVASIQAKIAQNQKEIDGQDKLTASQQEEIKLNEDLKSGKLRLTAAHEADIRARIAIAAAQEKAIESSKNEAAIIEQMRQIRMGMVGELERSAQAYINGNQALEDEIALIGKTSTERTKIMQARNQEIILIKKATLAEMERQDEVSGTQRRVTIALQEEIAQLERRNELLGLKDVKSEADKALAESKREYEQTIKQVEDIFVNGFADMMNNGKSGWESFCKSLRTSFYTLVAKQIYKMLAEPFVVNIVGNLLGFTGSAAAGAAGAAAAGGGGMFSNISSGLTGANALGLLGTFGGGMSAGFGGLMGSLGLSTTGATFGGAMSAGSIAIGSGNILGGLGTFVGALAPILGGLTLLFGGDIFGSLFGRKLKESGVEGTFGGDSGFEGRLFKYYKGGLFRSNKTTYEELPEEMRSALGNQFLAMDESIRAMAGAVGLGGEALDGFTAKIKVNLKGLSEEEATKKLQEEFQKIADQMGGLVLTTDEYTRAGETQLEALTRLSTSITLANEWFKAIGDTLYDVSLAGADMASELMDAFGGADKFAAATSNYYDKFYSDQEKVANQTRLLNEALKKLGVESMPTSREALREYINGIDLSTEAGRKLYAAMIGLADSFDVVYTSAENIAAMKEDLNVQLLRAQGKDDEATKLERAKQLKELEKYKDPELIRMQVEVWNAEDKAKSDAAAKQAAEDLAAEMAAAQKAAKDLAMKNLEAAVSRDKEYWNQFSADAKDALTKASSYFDLVTNAAKSLRDSVEDSASWSAAAGMVYIEQALDRARKGGGLSDLDATKSAIEAATGGLVMDNYATQAELDYDKKVLAGQLDELGGYAELAKSDAQKQIDLANAQIKRLDDTLTFWKEYGEEQVDATMSVTDAVNALYKLLDPKEQERIRKEEAAKAGLDGGGTPGKAGSGATLGGTVSGTVGRYVVGFTADGRAKWSDGTVEKYAAGQYQYDGHLLVGSGNLTSDQWAAMQAGQSVYGSDWYFDEKQGLWMKRKSFAVGTNYVPYDMTANIHQGERIIPAADNRALMAALNTQGGGNAELVQEVKAMRAELQAINHNTASSAQSGHSLDAAFNQASENGNALRVVVMK